MKSILDENISLKHEKDENGIKITVLSSFDEPLFLPLINEDITLILNPHVSLKLLEKEISSNQRKYILKEGATLKHNFLILNAEHEENREIEIEKNATWEVGYGDFSYSFYHSIMHCYLKGEGAMGSFHLASLARNDAKKIFDINFTHEVSLTESIMENYGVIRDEASLSFIGIGHIKRGAKKAKAKQATKIMVFDKKCNASASPILKIDENDVLASHAAAEGRINEEHLFYLMSRGLKEEEAKKIITLGYLNPILPFMFDDEIKKEVESIILERM